MDKARISKGLVLAGWVLAAFTGCETVDSGTKLSANGNVNQRRTYVCPLVEEAPIIDGDLNDPAWKRATLIDQFYRYPDSTDREPVPVARGTVRARIAYDAENLYVGMTIDDPDIVVNPAGTEDEKETMYLDGDVFEIFLMPGSNKTCYYEMHVNPLNVTWDTRFRARRYMRFADLAVWDSGGETAVALHGTVNTMDTDAGWSAEVAVPFASITNRGGEKVDVASGDAWRFTLCFYDYAYQHDDGENGSSLRYLSSAKLHRLGYHFRGDYDTMRFQ